MDATYTSSKKEVYEMAEWYEWFIETWYELIL